MGIGAIQFDYLRKFVRDFAAIEIESGKEYLAETRLNCLLGDEGCEDVSELVDRLRGQNFSHLHRKVLDAMTNNETWFFRDVVPFDVLGAHILPELALKRASERRLSIWSAACSTGQEAYSVAMLLREKGCLPGWNIEIVGTDISGRVLERARNGIYTQMEINRGLPAAYLTKYFEKNSGKWQIRPEIRNMVNFRALNLAEAWPAMPSFDIVFLRNVLIYFSIDVRRQVLGRLKRVLKPNGYLLLGSAETTLNVDDSFQRVQFDKMSCYQLNREPK